MKNPLFQMAAMAIVACAFLAQAKDASPSASHGIPNFAQVEPGVWRGGQPTPEGWKYLKSLGVTRDIKLNTEQEASDKGATTNGIQVLYFPIPTAQQTLEKPTTNTIHSAVAAIKTDGT